jgi:hypothetical protein
MAEDVKLSVSDTQILDICCKIEVVRVCETA